MRVNTKAKKISERPHILFKKGLVRQGFKHKVSTRPIKMPAGDYFRPKRLCTPLRHSLKYKNPREKTFRKTDCGCGCKGNK